MASSRRTGRLSGWQAEGVGGDIDKIVTEAHERFEKIWQGDIKKMTAEAMNKCHELLRELFLER